MIRFHPAPWYEGFLSCTITTAMVMVSERAIVTGQVGTLMAIVAAASATNTADQASSNDRGHADEVAKQEEVTDDESHNESGPPCLTPQHD